METEVSLGVGHDLAVAERWTTALDDELDVRVSLLCRAKGAKYDSPHGRVIERLVSKAEGGSDVDRVGEDVRIRSEKLGMENQVFRRSSSILPTR